MDWFAFVWIKWEVLRLVIWFWWSLFFDGESKHHILSQENAQRESVQSGAKDGKKYKIEGNFRFNLIQTVASNWPRMIRKNEKAFAETENKSKNRVSVYIFVIYMQTTDLQCLWCDLNDYFSLQTQELSPKKPSTSSVWNRQPKVEPLLLVFSLTPFHATTSTGAKPLLEINFHQQSLRVGLVGVLFIRC